MRTISLMMLVMLMLFGHATVCLASPRDVIPLPIKHVPDPNPLAIPIPTGAPTVKFGYVVTDAPGYEQYLYNNLLHTGLRTWAYRANLLGGFPMNGTQYYVELVVLSGGPSCSDFLILYEYLINTDNVSFIFSPVNPDCPQVSLLAEYYRTPVINAVDYVVAYLVQTPGQPFYNLSQTYTFTGNASLLAHSCVAPMYDSGARTYAIIYAGNSGQDVVPAAERDLASLGMTPVMNTTILDLTKQATASAGSDPCSYVAPYISQLKRLAPDFFIFSFGPTYTDDFITCMHRQRYYPKAFWLFTSSSFQGHDLWETAYSISSDLWIAGSNFTDPYMISVDNFTRTYVQLWGNSSIAQISYVATGAVAGSFTLEALTRAGSTDPDLFREAMVSLRIRTLIGDSYMLPGTQVCFHPFFCTQRAADTNPNGRVIYPYNTPGVVNVTYPAVLTLDPAFARSLEPKKHLSIGIIVAIALVSALVVGLLVAAVIYVVITRLYRLVWIPKSEEGSWDE